jgi:5'-methylthioadenosine phosphorylase
MMKPTSSDRADIGVFGGSGFYQLLDAVEEIEVDTPFGEPSDKIALGRIGGASYRAMV